MTIIFRNCKRPNGSPNVSIIKLTNKAELAPALANSGYFFKMFCSRVTAKRIVRLVSIVSFVVPALIVYKTQCKRKNITSEYIKPVKKSSLGNKELLLFVGIHSAPSRIDRRNAIRETWMKECQWNPNVVCRFFTDGQDPNGKELDGDKRTKLENETRVYGDILLAEAPGGINFAVKYLWMLQWANKMYYFRYFLRLDDDYFVCLHKLMVELEFFRPKEKFQWGWLHCELKGMDTNSAISDLGKFGSIPTDLNGL